MKAMLLAFVAMIIIAANANFVLQDAGFSAQDAATGSAVRLDSTGD